MNLLGWSVCVCIGVITWLTSGDWMHGLLVGASVALCLLLLIIVVSVLEKPKHRRY